MAKEQRKLMIILSDCEDYQFELVWKMITNLIYPCGVEFREIKS